MRPFLRRLGVTFGALDIFSRDLLKPGAREAMHAAGIDSRPLEAAMRSVLPGEGKLPAGYRPAGEQYVRVDVAEKLVKAAHEARAASAKDKAKDKKRPKTFHLDPALAVSTGLTPESWQRLLGAAGFRVRSAKALPEGAFGPPAPDAWSWQPGAARKQRANKPRGGTRLAKDASKGKDRGRPPHRGKGKPAPRPKDTGPATSKAFAGLADLMKK